VPGIELTMATFLFNRLLIKVLFPTFGLPKIDILIPYRAFCNLEEESNILLTLSIILTAEILASSNKWLPV